MEKLQTLCIACEASHCTEHGLENALSKYNPTNWNCRNCNNSHPIGEPQFITNEGSVCYDCFKNM